MQVEEQIKSTISEVLKVKYKHQQSAGELALQPTKKEFVGDYTFVVFPFVKLLKLAPAQIAQDICEVLNIMPIVASTNVVQGFVNIKLHDSTWYQKLQSIIEKGASYYQLAATGQNVMLEYSSPNTNKPLHLGHLRNNFLGYAMAQILQKAGYAVQKSSVVNNRGIHICKSMLAYQKFGQGETPQSVSIKGDHLVGKYYVAFDKVYKAEIEQLVANGVPEDTAKKEAPILKEAQQMLLLWEQGNKEVHDLWLTMNQWVYDGFAQTYSAMGVSFDTVYYESDLYLDGKNTIEKGLADGVFYQKSDGSIWVDLSAEGLDHKLLLRGDGTAVYITQDLALADKKYVDFPMQRSIYVVGNEQDYHFDVLFHIMKKLERPFATGLYHLSYGMVDLPSGKMKSREGTVVDADELMAEMEATAEATTKELGKTQGFEKEELIQLYNTLGMGALKYFLLKVDPKKRMLFNPAESIEFQGNTGPFIQYTHARIKSILRKATEANLSHALADTPIEMQATELELVKLLDIYPEKLAEAAQNYAPSVIAQYAYDLAKAFNGLYAEVGILAEPNLTIKQYRLALIRAVAETILQAMALLGIRVPERM
jgi:arginyl-tRNA synthetase